MNQSTYARIAEGDTVTVRSFKLPSNKTLQVVIDGLSSDALQQFGLSMPADKAFEMAKDILSHAPKDEPCTTPNTTSQPAAQSPS